MITGTVSSDEARIRLRVKGRRGREREVVAVIDTGFTASLSLPPALVAELGLRWQTFERGVLADGSECLFDVYEVNVLWDGELLRILADEADSEPLVGMELLRGFEVKMEVRTGGNVSIRSLP